MQIFVKNMVCNRCITAVENIFEGLDIKVENIQLGMVQTSSPLSKDKLAVLNTHLQKQGFKVLEKNSEKLIEQVKKSIILLITELDIPEDFILSEFLAQKLHKHYTVISKTFSQQENITLEQYFILQKIEKVKEMLLYNEFTLTEISAKLGYKSVQHLSSQFKIITGFSPTTFKALKVTKRIPLDKI